jgi:hypothetical protein
MTIELRKAGFSNTEIRLLMESGIIGSRENKV